MEIICILDRSASMQHLTQEVINSFNNFIKEQKKIEGKANVTLVLFDDKIETPFQRVSLKKFKKINEETYYTRGMTSLYDAIGQTLNNEIFKDKKKAIVLIQTDGQENASQEFNNESVKKLVEEKKGKGWDFLFLGANIDSFAVGSSFGLTENDTIDFAATAKGLSDSYMQMSTRTVAYRA